jgi:aryl-phospho-beta-D-glucosidase BglC (GH1 family)
MRNFLHWLVFGLAAIAPSVAPQVARAQTLPNATAQHLPRWRGFNLLEKFYRQRNNGPFLESDFRLIQELGFNFVRLPMDYRVWIKNDDWNQFDESQLQHIDQAVAWGKKYSIHVCINFHRAPGYTVAKPPEATDLWTDPIAQRVCAEHWALFAKRYRGIPNEQLSFNLFNEPSDVPTETYVNVVRKIAAAIRAEDPQRLIISDGLAWGREPIPELAKLQIALATRGYTPMDITHYKAGWVDGADRYPDPIWPRVMAYGTLFSPSKPGMSQEAQRPMVIEATFDRATPLRMRVNVVSSKARMVAKADGTVFWQKAFDCGPGAGEWKQVNYVKQWKTYQNVYDRDYEAIIPAGTRRVELAVTQGDWLSLSEIGMRRADGQEDRLFLRPGWDQPVAHVSYNPADRNQTFAGPKMEDRQWLWETTIFPWQQAQKQGIGVMVGEFGSHNQTPHDVTLAWMEDCLANWQQADWGWALWNFRGSFGILDSQRDDVQYEQFQGHQLDRKMLDLLQRY